MEIILVSLKQAGNNLDKSDTAAVIGVNVRVNFKYKAAKLILCGDNQAFFCLFGLWAWRYLNKAIKEFFDTKIIEG